MKQITGDYIKSNILSIHKYFSKNNLDFYFKTRTRSSASICIDYLNGLILVPSRKNIRKMAVRCCNNSNNQSLSHFLSNSPWSSSNLLKYVQNKSTKIIGKNGVLILDDTGIKKYGNCSVGASRQYLGNQGKKELCQVSVCLSYAKEDNRMLIDERLYLPEKWITDKDRCLKAKIPLEEIRFRTKHELGLEMIDNAINGGIPFSFVAMDGFYGKNSELLTKLENRGLTFVADIPSNTQVYLEKPLVGIPSRKGKKGREPTTPKVLNTTPINVSSLSGRVEGWKYIKVRKTERGYKEVNFMVIRVWRRQNHLPTKKPLWLLISKDLESNETKYSFCNASEDTPIVKLAKMQSSRFWIERAFEDAKGNCGMADYMVRNWNAWHHHMALVMLAMLILLSYFTEINKMFKVSLKGIIMIMLHHNPLKNLDAWEIAKIISQDNELRMRARVSRLKSQHGF
jgi:SRSO17 transposase